MTHILAIIGAAAIAVCLVCGLGLLVLHVLAKSMSDVG